MNNLTINSGKPFENHMNFAIVVKNQCHIPMVQIQESAVFFLYDSLCFQPFKPLERLQDFQEAKPYGMFDKPHVFLSSALLIPVLGLNITGWMVFSHVKLWRRSWQRALWIEDWESSQLEAGWNSLIRGMSQLGDS